VPGVTDKAMMGRPPEIGLRPGAHDQGLALSLPRRRFVQPLHRVRLSLYWFSSGSPGCSQLPSSTSAATMPAMAMAAK
jgi:hypothetical protein